MTARAPTPTPSSRRASALTVALILLAVLSFVTLGAVAPGADDTQVASLRVETLRAFYAAEAGIWAAVKQQSIDGTTPLTGAVTVATGQTFTVITPFAASPLPPGSVLVEGASGRATRRVAAGFQ